MTKKGLTQRELAAATERLRQGGRMVRREFAESTPEQYRELLEAMKDGMYIRYYERR